MRRMLIAVALAAGMGASLGATARAQDPETYVINLRDTDIAALAEQVSTITGRTLVLDPNLSGNVTVVSSEPLDEDGVWALFQSTLRVRGYVAVRSGVVWEVVPEADARTKSGPVVSGEIGSQDVVTQMLRLNRLPAEEAVRVLGPLVDDAGYIEALPEPNAIVITDQRANVDRIVGIARAFDDDRGIRSEIVRFRFADATTVGRAITEVLGPAGTGARLSVEPESNLLLVRGSDADIDQIRMLASAMDIAPRVNPQEAIGTTVFRLQFGDAEVVAETIRNTLQGGTDITNPVAASIGEGPEDGAAVESLGGGVGNGAAGGVVLGASGQPAEVREVSIEASTETNAVVVRGTAGQITEVASLVRALDVRRAQVTIEAAIVEVSGDLAERLGVQLGFGDASPPGGIAATSFANSGTPLQSVLVALGQTNAVALSTGLSAGVANDDFGALIQALSQSTSANLLSTPSITTLDNQPATIIVGQNVPFRTGSFATDGNTLAPFTTIERQDVGITMEVLPRVTAGGVVRLEIAQEVSSLVNTNVEGAADLITNRRVINTTVLADDGGTVVLGGLITDDETGNTSKVPVLGDVPVLGNLFRSRATNQTRRTLFVFMRPTILRSQDDIEGVASRTYNRVRAAQAGEVPRTLPQGREVEKLPLEIRGLY